MFDCQNPIRQECESIY